MKRYKSSDLTQKRSEVIKEAKENGVIIECRNTNGDAVDELVMCSARNFDSTDSGGEFFNHVWSELWGE